MRKIINYFKTLKFDPSHPGHVEVVLWIIVFGFCFIAIASKFFNYAN